MAKSNVNYKLSKENHDFFYRKKCHQKKKVKNVIFY